MRTDSLVIVVLLGTAIASGRCASAGAEQAETSPSGGTSTLAPAPPDSADVALRFDLQPLPTDGSSPAKIPDAASAIAPVKRRLENLGIPQAEVRAIGATGLEVKWPRSANLDLAAVARDLVAPGSVEFRITVDRSELSENQYRDAEQNLRAHGADERVPVEGVPARWFKMDPPARREFPADRFTIATLGDAPYVLCYDDAARSLTQAGPQPWRISAGRAKQESYGLALPFSLDPAGGKLMGELTKENLHHAMAILVDGVVLCAPTIQGRITDQGTIALGENRTPEEVKKEAERLRRTINAGPLPVRLKFAGQPSQSH